MRLLQVDRLRNRWVAALAAVAIVAPGLAGGKKSDPFRFAAEMAEEGNWREAYYRWERIQASEPDNPKVLNNLAVAAEALGQVDEAERLYRKAQTLAPGEPTIRENADRALRFWADIRGEDEDPVALRHSADNGGKSGKKQSKKTKRVQIALPVPPRIDVGERRSVLVASFLSADDQVLDANRELARFLRSEFRQISRLTPIDATPPPAIPEQSLDDLIANDEFWRFLGKRHDADLIVSGAVGYDRRDISGFRDVDVVSSTTGQKVRQTRFVEEEEFVYTLTLLFFDGRTGELLYRDVLNRGVVFRGQNNDPITAFHDLSESIAADVIAVVSPQKRFDYRIIYGG